MTDTARRASERTSRDQTAPSDTTSPPSGVEMIAAERRRQIDEECYTDEHDDKHIDDSLAKAAAIYAWPGPRPALLELRWPWADFAFNPALAVASDSNPLGRLRDLARAGALIAAEIDRIQRMVSEAAGE
ncbi:MAG: hypothetical protein JWO05_1165 [Gemmatimonadetes bacterium]|nr:hypothetical protein [Gemmatimonadota bacterium]